MSLCGFSIKEMQTWLPSVILSWQKECVNLCMHFYRVDVVHLALFNLTLTFCHKYYDLHTTILPWISENNSNLNLSNLLQVTVIGNLLPLNHWGLFNSQGWSLNIGDVIIPVVYLLSWQAFNIVFLYALHLCTQSRPILSADVTRKVEAALNAHKSK